VSICPEISARDEMTPLDDTHSAAISVYTILMHWCRRRRWWRCSISVLYVAEVEAGYIHIDVQSFTERLSLVWSSFGRIQKFSCLDFLARWPNDPAMGNVFGGHAEPGSYRDEATESTPMVLYSKRYYNYRTQKGSGTLQCITSSPDSIY